MKKNNKSPFYYVFMFLVIVFVALYIALESGYYENKVSKKVAITESAITEFENDVKEGNEIDIKEYLEDDYIDYSSGASRMGIKVSGKIENFMTSGIEKFFKLLGKLF